MRYHYGNPPPASPGKSLIVLALVGCAVACSGYSVPAAVDPPATAAGADSGVIRTSLATHDARQPETARPDSLQRADLITGEDLARRLAAPAVRRPVLLHVGFKVLFRSGHVPGSRYVGPASKPEGVEALKRVLRMLPTRTALVLYCGCCPWSDCPNVRPAFRTARAVGFKDVKVLFVAKNLQHDWIDKGLPIKEGDQ